MKKLFNLIALCLAAATVQPAVAAPILDQNNPDVLDAFCNVIGGDLCGQSFRQTATTISGAGFFVMPDSVGSDGTVTISIFQSYGEGSASGLVASGSAALATLFTGWVDVFWNPVAVTAGAQYYMVLSADNNPAAAYSPAATYAGGNVLYDGNANDFADFDLTFRTFADDGAAVPEPGSLTLLGLGLAAVGAGMRRKRA